MIILSGTTADDVWRASASLFRPGGPAVEQPGRGGPTRELLHVAIEIEQPSHRWVISRRPAMNPAFALVETLWIAGGRQDSLLPARWNPRLREFCGDAAELGGAYGYRLRKHFGFDQLERMFRALEANPTSRQAVLQIWDPVEDLPTAGGQPARADIPCNVLSMPKVRQGRLEWLQIMRSNDLFRGLPYNLVQFTILQEMVAGWLGISAGRYHHVSDSLHVYETDLDDVMSSVVRPVAGANQKPSASFGLPWGEWSDALANALKRLDGLVSDVESPGTLLSLATAADLPDAYESAVRIAAADIARRRGWADLAARCCDACDDTGVRDSWVRWARRGGGRVVEGSNLAALQV